jgi:hypothetical protein
MVLESLVWALLILSVPLWLALPVSLLWHSWTGSDPEHEEYRSKVQQVLDSGQPLRRYRQELDREARRWGMDSSAQAKVETGLLYPLGPAHFILLPGLALWPLMSLLAVPLTLPLIPLMRLMEWILIDKKVLATTLAILLKWTRWEVIAIPTLDDGAKDIDNLVISISRLPVTVFLGLFAFLMAAYLPTSATVMLIVSAVIYLFLAALISIITAATSGALVFADTAKRRLTPVESFVDDRVAPIVGVGLVLLLGRQLMQMMSGAGSTLFSDPVVFALIVLGVLYTATLVGVAVEFTFFRRRGAIVRHAFMTQVIQSHQPMVYQYTRHLGNMELTPRITMQEWLAAAERLPDDDGGQMTFEELDESESLIDSVSRPVIP